MRLANTLLTTAFILIGALVYLSLTENANAATESEKFVTKASMGNAFEIVTSKLALEKGQSPDVKSFAQKMVDDHETASKKLESTVSDSRAHSQAITATLDTKHDKLLKKLQKADSNDFDKEYLKIQKDAHDDAVTLFRDYAKDGNDPRLKTFAGELLPKLEEHQSHVKGLLSKK